MEQNGKIRLLLVKNTYFQSKMVKNGYDSSFITPIQTFVEEDLF